MQELENPKEVVLRHVRFLKRIYSLEGDSLPIPTNTKAVLNSIGELLAVAGTNSLYFAPPEVKLTALGYVLMLISHCVDMPALGFTVLDPHSQLWLARGKGEGELDDLERLTLSVKRFLDSFEAEDKE